MQRLEEKGFRRRESSVSRSKPSDKRLESLLKEEADSEMAQKGEKSEMRLVLEEITKLSESIRQMNQKVDNIEQKVDDMTKQISANQERSKEVSKKLDSHVKKTEEHLQQLQSQANRNFTRIMDNELVATDLQHRMVSTQDYNRRNNIRIKGLPDLGPKEKELTELVLEWLKKRLPKIDWTVYDLDKIHRVGPKRRDQPRHILIRFSSLRKKEELMKALRENPGSLVIAKYPVQIFNDFSHETMQFRRKMRVITSILQKKSVKYSWGYPLFLKIYHDGKFNKVISVQMALDFLKDSGILTRKEWEEQMRLMKKSGSNQESEEDETMERDSIESDKGEGEQEQDQEEEERQLEEEQEKEKQGAIPKQPRKTRGRGKSKE
ncbi:uncharacterized protein LOC144586276 [Pogona vitticeps]